jgi:transcriptional regulator with XRE-family HTH domain
MMNLSAYLKANGETQKQFADRIGKTQGFVSRLCSEHPRLRLETAVAIEEATGGAVPVLSWPQFSMLHGRLPREAAE